MSVYSIIGLETYVGGQNQFAIDNVQEGYVLTDGGPGSPSSFQALPASSQPTQSSANRSLNTAFQISATKNSLVNYSVDITSVATLSEGDTGTIFLEIASDSGFTEDVQELARFVNGNTISLAIAITHTQTVTGNLSGFVPSAYYVRLRTVNTTGTPDFNYRSGQEVLL